MISLVQPDGGEAGMVTKSSVQKAITKFLSGKRPPNYGAPRSWYVLDPVRKSEVPLKGVWALANDVASRSFKTNDAIREVRKLGFDVIDRRNLVDRDAEREEDIQAIKSKGGLSTTERDELIKARRGQGKYRRRLERVEHRCRITGVADRRFLRASHVKPWRLADDDERLDGQNGLLLTPAFDLLFDQGFLSFRDDGVVMVSDRISKEDLKRLGFELSPITKPVPFRERQLQYLSFHREHFGFV